MKVLKVFVCLLTAVALAMAVFGCAKVAPKKAEPVATTAQAAEEIVVNVVIDGSNGEDKAISCEKKLTLSSGVTAYDALKKLCDEEGYEITGNPSYVKTIGGLGEGSFGATPCGWMFSVDGKYPSEAANESKLEDGSKLVWEFIK